MNILNFKTKGNVRYENYKSLLKTNELHKTKNVSPLRHIKLVTQQHSFTFNFINFINEYFSVCIRIGHGK
jgi:hypothetical protein